MPIPPSAATTHRPLPAVDLMGLNVAAVSLAGLESHILSSLHAGSGGTVVTANLDHLRAFVRSPSQRRLIDSAEVVVADGMPLIWASRIAGRPLPERIAGADLVQTLPPRLAEAGFSLFIVGGRDDAAELAAESLCRSTPQLSIAGAFGPPLGFERSPEQLDATIDRVAAAEPDVVFVGLGFPKQDRLIERLRLLLPGTWLIGCGVAVEQLAGYASRAPIPLQRLGLEWLFRLATEPRKLWRRYLVNGIPFAGRLLSWSIAARANLDSRPTDRNERLQGAAWSLVAIQAESGRGPQSNRGTRSGV
jgi:exopolysaccharide biosynthesis WecB/TagA/CpsF family protein